MSAPSIEERRDCPHGHQWGKCDVCDRMECERELAAMTARAEAAERECEINHEALEVCRHQVEWQVAIVGREQAELRPVVPHVDGDQW